jgi:two-component system, chemotaxis family, response regulator Rcp1
MRAAQPHQLGVLPTIHMATERYEVKFEEGTDFTCTFTLSASRHDEKGGAGAMKLLPQVLLVDDNPADVGLAQEALAGGRHQSQISHAADGEEALAFLRRQGRYADVERPDFVILDLNLPRKDGRAVLAEAKSDPDLRTIPIVVFSTSRSMLDIARSYELGANCYVSKPGNLDDYFRALQAIEEFWLGCANLPREEK